MYDRKIGPTWADSKVNRLISEYFSMGQQQNQQNNVRMFLEVNY